MATPPPPAQPSTEELPFRVLVIISRPLDESELPNIADQWALYSGLSAVKTPARLDFLRPPTIEQLRTEILGGYDVVHFDGHGSFGRRCPSCSGLNPPEGKKCGRCNAVLEYEEAGGYLAFEGEDGTVDSLAAEDLAGMINAVPGRPTKLVILSACESAKGGDASLLAVLTREGVPAVMGMREPVPVELTVALSRPLYAYLGAGNNIKEAFDQARPSLAKLPKSEEGTPAEEIPILEGDGTGARIVDRPMRGEVVVERERIFGVPEYDFVGEFIRGDPPRGRKGLLARTVRALNGGERLVVLTGQGGIGKSVLGAEAARRIAWRYPGGVFWRSGAEIENMSLNELLDAFVNVFGYEFRTRLVDEKRDIVLGYLRDLGTASLIVVDNAETIKDPAVFRFLEGIPRPSAALVTSREALEREGTHIDIDEMEPLEATRLFIVEARRRKPGWGEKLTSSDLKAMRDISGHLDGHPLAIKLAAAMVGSDSLATICQRVLAAPHKEVSTRFDFSYNPLPEGEKELLHRMAAFASSATEVVIEMTSTLPLFEGDATAALPQWRDDLTELVRKSFVDTVPVTAFDDSGDEVTWQRYRLHSLMRQYASGKAGEGAMKIHLRRAANIFLAYATLFEEDYNALQAEHENILAGLDWAYAAKEWEMVRSLVSATEFYLRTRGYWNEDKIRLKQAMKACESLGDKAGVAISLHQLGILAQDTGDIDEARRLYGDSLKIAQELGYKSGVAKSLGQLGMLAQDTGDIDEARRLYSDSLKTFQELGDKDGVAKSLGQLGMLAQGTGDIIEARRLYAESLKIAQDLGDKSGIASSLHQLGMLAQDTGDIDEARRLYAESMKIAQEMGDKDGVAITLANSSILEEGEGNLDQALDLIRMAEKLFLELGSPKATQARQIRERLEQKAQDKPSSFGRIKRWLGLG
ncbi:tetratricopeptide repeat protein [Methanotrichaceae archaeon M04Ac]|uniref:Tetratricopeptide repeat protein n=1 Tax=Candidatus Methanocrinis alkalitolerans TaxID=3033395 RepID=A0ABT5XGH8_9EURY|nr:tetratricopeptide repeat protein [Candidatus Methanocrinis alkalitolerans]MDF0593777.1 tetratricopeptide repeat protein [Candidatus Methanocrinis alkalitolerans]